LIGKHGIEKAFEQKFSNRFNINRTRQDFPADEIDTFENTAQIGIMVTDRVIEEEIGVSIDLEKNTCNIPL
tara:strand:- start:132 stop:344 length:213 start_codon:yes stop_codon:yes gene_type:complete